MPKRINNIFLENVTFSKLLQAHNKTKKGKRFKKQVIEFEMELESNIIKIGEEIRKGTYQFSEYFEFKIYEPKERIIKTLSYRDRVVQTWYVENFLKPYFQKGFIEESFACIETRGTHKAVDKLQEYLIKADREYNEVWVLKCDIKKFFFNIDRDILLGLLKRKIKYIIKYMDDYVVLAKSKQQAKELLVKIKEFLKENLKLELNSKTSYFKASQGINFCGFRIWKTHRLLRNESKNNMKRKLRNFEKLYKQNRIQVEYVTSCINSWKGHASHCNSYHLVNSILDKFVLKKRD